MINPWVWFSILGVIWGSNFIFMKIAVSVISPDQVAWFRVFTGAIPILAFAFWRNDLKWRDIKKAHHFVAMALFANAVPFYFLVMGTQLLKAGIAGVISGMIPLMTVLVAVPLIPEEKLSRSKVIGLLLGFSGVTMVAEVWHKWSGFDGEILGVSYILLACASYAISFVYARKFISPLGIRASALAAYQISLATVLLTLVTDFRGVSALLLEPWKFLALGIGLGLLGTGIAYMIYYFIIDRLGAVTASSVTYIPPVVALLLGVSFMGDTVSAFQIAGTVMIMTGIYFARGGSTHAKKV